MELANLGWAAPASGDGGGLQKLLSQLPDPMRPYLGQLIFVIALVVTLHWVLKLGFYRSISRTMSERVIPCPLMTLPSPRSHAASTMP